MTKTLKKHTNEDWLDVCKLQWKCTNFYALQEFGWKCFIHFFNKQQNRNNILWRGCKCWRQGGFWEAETHMAYTLGVSSDKTFLGRVSQRSKKYT